MAWSCELLFSFFFLIRPCVFMQIYLSLRKEWFTRYHATFSLTSYRPGAYLIRPHVNGSVNIDALDQCFPSSWVYQTDQIITTVNIDASFKGHYQSTPSRPKCCLLVPAAGNRFALPTRQYLVCSETKMESHIQKPLPPPLGTWSSELGVGHLASNPSPEKYIDHYKNTNKILK